MLFSYFIIGLPGLFRSLLYRVRTRSYLISVLLSFLLRQFLRHRRNLDNLRYLPISVSVIKWPCWFAVVMFAVLAPSMYYAHLRSPY